MRDLKVTIVQTALHWESPIANMGMLEEKIWHHHTDTDIIILPEMFTTGFTMNAPALAEPMNLTTMKWMKQIAEQTGAAVVGSYIVKDDFKYYNRLLWMLPTGVYHFYDKRHLFRMAGEAEVYSMGSKTIIVEIKGWKICPLICYDLRFPVWSRNIKNKYDVLMYVANWPTARVQAWNTLLKARAIENLSYVVGVNRVGEDGNKTEYNGSSTVIDFKGEQVFNLIDEEIVHTHTLHYEALQGFRNKFPAHLDADDFSIGI